MSFYDLEKEERLSILLTMKKEILEDLKKCESEKIKKYGSDFDTFIRKNTYLIIGKYYKEKPDLRENVLEIMKNLFMNKDEKLRQTVVNTLGQIGILEPNKVLLLLELALTDEHFMVRNAVINALKQISQKQPKATLPFAKKFLNHPNPKVRREIMHGIEFRGRTHPEDILPVLKYAQNDPDSRVKSTLIHVLGQISYKEGCLEKVISALKKWENKEVVKRALREIINTHERYSDFAFKKPEEVKTYIKNEFN